MQEPIPGYIPPYAFVGDPPLYNPNGPVGQLIDASSERPVTIGQLAQSEYPPIHGWWVVGEGNYAIPDYRPSPAEQFAMMAAQYAMMESQYYATAYYDTGQSNTSAEFMTALLLIMF